MKEIQYYYFQLNKFVIKFKILTMLPIVITSLILIIIFKHFSIYDVLGVYHQSNKIYILLAVAILIITHILSVRRWQIILRLVGYKINFKKLLILFLANLPISKILPSYSGDFFRAFILRKDVPITKSAAIILFEGLADILVLSMLSLCGGIISGILIITIISAIIIVIIILFIKVCPLLILKLPDNIKYKNKLMTFFSVFTSISSNFKRFFMIIIYTILMWTSMLLSIKLLFSAFFFDVPFYLVATLQPVSILVSLLPVTISGIGTRELSMIFLFGNFISQDIILATSLFYSFLSVIILPTLASPITYFVLKNK